MVTYEPGVYEVKITGKNVNKIDLNSISSDIVSIKSWGNTDVEDMCFYLVSDKLIYMAAPNAKSFHNLKNFMISSTVLEYIPDEMFKNCNNLENVWVSGEKIKYIPDNLFGDMDTSKIYIDFKGCTSALNYNSIPDEWKQ